MKIVYNKIIPFGAYKIINLYGILFAKCEEDDIKQKDLNHEGTHTYQMDDFVLGLSWLRLIGGTIFYLWYGIEFVFRFFQYGFDWHTAYKNISFEREAFANQYDDTYLANRKRFAFVDYIVEEDEE